MTFFCLNKFAKVGCSIQGLGLFETFLPSPLCPSPYHTSSCHFELGHMHLGQTFLPLLMRWEKISNFLNVGHEKSTEVGKVI